MSGLKLLASTIATLNLVATAANACNLAPESSYYWSQERLVGCTKNIVVAKLVGSKLKESALKLEKPKYVSSPKPDFILSGAGIHRSDETEWIFEVQKSVKGTKLKSGDVFHVATFPNRSGINIVDTLGGACSMTASFRPGMNYIVFVDSFHPKGYQFTRWTTYPSRRDGRKMKDDWLEKIKKEKGQTMDCQGLFKADQCKFIRGQKPALVRAYKSKFDTSHCK